MTTRDLPRLRDHIVFLEMTDTHDLGLDPKQYLAAARSARDIMERELGSLGMESFALTGLPTVQTTAENIYFDSYRCFADLDGSGDAFIVQAMADELIARAR